MKGRNGSTAFLPLNKKGGLIKNVSAEKYLIEDQTKYEYDKVELGDEIKVRKEICPELQKLLKPTYEEIKQKLQKPPVLHMPDKVGRFQLYSDTSKYAMGSAFYQIQNGKLKLITYASVTHSFVSLCPQVYWGKTRHLNWA